jgi:hypothetical protein
MASGGAWGQAAPEKTLLRELPRINEVHIDGLVSEAVGLQSRCMPSFYILFIIQVLLLIFAIKKQSM